jgi:uncharacterized phage-associated protein
MKWFTNALTSFGKAYLPEITRDLTPPNHYIGKLEEKIVNQPRAIRRSGERFRMGQMTYTPQQIANFFLDCAEEEGKLITQMKLHKLVYIAYGWYIALTNERLFEDRIEAWEHGPVVKSLREEFKNFGREPITVKSIVFDWETLEEQEPRVPSKDYDTNAVLDRVWESYKTFSAATLRNKTHEVGSPWHKAYKNGDGYGSEIDDKDIAEHYRERIKKYIDAATSLG